MKRRNLVFALIGSGVAAVTGLGIAFGPVRAADMPVQPHSSSHDHRNCCAAAGDNGSGHHGKQGHPKDNRHHQ